jgi:hypothetical protein
MRSADLFVPENPADLKDLIPPLGQKLFHAVLGRSMQIHSPGAFFQRLDEDFRGQEMGLHPGRRDKVRGFHFHKTITQEILPDPLDDLSPQDQIFSSLFVHIDFNGIPSMEKGFTRQAFPSVMDPLSFIPFRILPMERG